MAASTSRPRSKKKHPSTRLLTAVALLGLSITGAAIGLPLSCTQTLSPVTPAAQPLSQPGRSQASTPPKKSAAKAGPKKKAQSSYADALRRRQFKRAAWLMEGTSEQEKSSPELRYARALVALELSDVETALRSVDNLEVEWPLFSAEADEIRLRAAKISQDLTLLSLFLAKSQKPQDLLLLAEAHEHGSSNEKARSIAQKVLKSLSRSKRRDRLELRARAHWLLARNFESEGKNKEAASEYHWLATQGASLPLPFPKAALGDEVPSFDERMHALDPSRNLSKKERLKRAEAFSKRALVRKTEEELEKLRPLPGAGPSKSKADALVAWALYSSRADYLRASELFANAAGHGGPNKKEHLYYEAKALARSHRDAEAIGKYEALAKLGGGFAEHAAYQAGRLLFIDGQWKAATISFEKYLTKYAKGGKHREATHYDLPIARLAAGQFAKAGSELKALIKGEDSPRIRARLSELRAVALLGSGKKSEAAALFRKVILDRPLSFPALLAAARLRQLDQEPPSLIPKGPQDASPERAPLALSLPEKVWRLSRVGLDAQAESSLRHSEAAIRKKYGTRGGEALCRLYGQLESAKRRFQVAQTAASWSVLKVAPNARSDWQWECIYPSPYHEVVEEEAALRKVPAPFIYSVMRQESAFRPTVVSPAKAVGLMQIIPPTANRIAEEIDATYRPDLMRAPAINIGYGTYYLRRLLDMFGDRPELAAASYNAGPMAVTRWLRAGESLPLDLFIARIPYTETRNYVYRVMGNYARYSYLSKEVDVPQIDLKLPTGLKAPEDAY